MKETYTVHGAHESYYTGKIEAYFRAKGIAYRNAAFTPSGLQRCAEHTGVMQIPQVQCPDGSWLIDTTAIIEFFERTHRGPALSPQTPALKVLSLLLEDYADEWLWRPAMHYRWSYRTSARLASHWLAEHLVEIPGPNIFKVWYFRARQTYFFVRADGVNARTRSAVEESYLSTLASLETIFQERPFLLGERPTEADFGFFASMYRHFFCDPASGRIMRERAPAVQEWAARMWNMTPERSAAGALPETLPKDLSPLLKDIATIYLPYLKANEEAFAKASSTTSYRVQGTSFTEPTKPYRVWCLAKLREAFQGLGDEDRRSLETLFEDGALAPLSQPQPVAAPDLIGELPIPANAKAEIRDSWWRK